MTGLASSEMTAHSRQPTKHLPHWAHASRASALMAFLYNRLFVHLAIKRKAVDWRRSVPGRISPNPCHANYRKLILRFFLSVSKSYRFQASFRQSSRFPTTASPNCRTARYGTTQFRKLESSRTAVIRLVSAYVFFNLPQSP
jgi:hypothetical protein